jgi:LCP family protein required for cell wall assembly
MSDEDWKGWYQDDRPSPSASGPRYEPRSGSGSGAGSGSGYSGGAGYEATHSVTAPAGGGRGWPSQPPPRSAPRGPGEPSPGGLGGGGRRWRFWGQPGRRGRRIALIAGIVVLILIVVAVSSYFWADGKLNKSVTLPATTATSAGTNWLIAGSDSRQGLSRAQIDALHVGFDSGTLNSDSLMLLHMGGPKPVLISIPRDSYVPIPGHGMNKINAALAFGGPTLLIQTVESVTGLRIDHYMGIGFAGLVSVVNTVGGVRICLSQAIPADSYSGLSLSKGCHNLNGTQALAFVRDRHSFATSDLQRIQDQRAFLKSLLSKATSPGVYLNPFTAYPFASTAAGSIAVDKGTSLYDLIQAGLALRGAQTGTVPIANPAYQTNAGEAVLWNRTQALQLFGALQDNKAVPAGLLSGTTVG